MKKSMFFALTLIMLSSTIFSFKSEAQTKYYGNSISRPVTAATVNNGWVSFESGEYENSAKFLGFETASTHNYTILGVAPLVKITTTRLDTITLARANFGAGQVVRLLTTTSANDSTLLLPDGGTINGAASFWHVGAVSSYKGTTVMFDGTNFFILK